MANLNVFGCDFDGLTGEICALRCQILHPNVRLPAPGSRIRYPADGPQYTVTGMRRDPFPPGAGFFILWEVEEVAAEEASPSEAE